MMNYSEAVDMIETAISKGQSFLGIRNLKMARHIEERETFPCDLDGRRSQIDAGIVCAVLREFQSVGSNAAADLENLLVPVACKTCDLRNIPFASSITSLSDFFEILPSVLCLR